MASVEVVTPQDNKSWFDRLLKPVSIGLFVASTIVFIVIVVIMAEQSEPTTNTQMVIAVVSGIIMIPTGMLCVGFLIEWWEKRQLQQ